jgi:hypothetical protein
LFGIDFRHAVEFSRSGRTPRQSLSTRSRGDSVKPTSTEFRGLTRGPEANLTIHIPFHIRFSENLAGGPNPNQPGWNFSLPSHQTHRQPQTTGDQIQDGGPPRPAALPLRSDFVRSSWRGEENTRRCADGRSNRGLPSPPDHGCVPRSDAQEPLPATTFARSG